MNKEVKSKGLLVSAHGAEWGGWGGKHGPSLSLELQFHSLPWCVFSSSAHAAGGIMKAVAEP